METESARRRNGKRPLSPGGTDRRSSAGRVLGMLADGELVTSLQQGIGCELRNCADPPELLHLVGACRADAVVIGPLDANGRPNCRLVEELRALSATLRIVVYGELTCAAGHALLDLGRAGADQVVFHGVDDRAAGWHLSLCQRRTPSITETILSCVAGRLDPRLQALVRFALDNAAERLNTAQVGSVAGVAPRTVRGWASAGGFAGLRGLIMDCKVAVALALVLECRYRVEAAALELGFSSASHLCNAMKRRTRATFREIRERPDLGHWCRLIFRISPHSSDSNPASQERVSTLPLV